MSKKGGVPTAAERKACHASRDAFFECLEKNDDNESKCIAEKRVFDDMCPKTWVKYFCRRRDYQKYSEKLGTEGFIPAEKDTE